MLKNENKLEEMVDILRYHHEYVPSVVHQEKQYCSTGESVAKERTTLHPILFGRDQLTAARIRGAMKVRVNSNSSSKKVCRHYTSCRGIGIPKQTFSE